MQADISISGIIRRGRRARDQIGRIVVGSTLTSEECWASRSLGGLRREASRVCMIGGMGILKLLGKVVIPMVVRSMECPLRAYVADEETKCVPFVDGTEESTINTWFNPGVTFVESPVRVSLSFSDNLASRIFQWSVQVNSSEASYKIDLFQFNS